MPTVNRKAPNERHVQSNVFSKDHWTYDQARDWSEKHGYYVDGHDETGESHRFRQYDPEDDKFDYFNEEHEQEKGLTQVMGYPQKNSDSDHNNDRTGMVGNALQAICGTPWAIQEEALQTIVNIAARDNLITPQVLQEKLGRSLDNNRRVRVRDTANGPVAIIPVTGPIFKGANLFTMISGATSNEDLVRDIARARDDAEISGIVLSIDSPGGTVSGTQEVAQTVYDTRAVKPITAYVEGTAASGAYWIAAAAERIVMSRTSRVGSIGVVATMRKDSDKNYREIVSSASPQKRPDVDTEEGYQEVLAEVDALADEFIGDVARFRQVTENRVRTHFGRGGMRVGKAAVKAKMADELQNRFEKFLPTAAKRTVAVRESSSLTYKEAVGIQTNTETTNTEAEKPMTFKELLGKGKKETTNQETEAEKEARAQRLQAAFPEDEKYAEAQFDKGNDVAAAVTEKVSAQDEQVRQAQSERDAALQELEAKKADVQKYKEAAEKAEREAAEQKAAAEKQGKRAEDAENRPKVLGGEGAGSDDYDETVKTMTEGFNSRRN